MRAALSGERCPRRVVCCVTDMDARELIAYEIERGSSDEERGAGGGKARRATGRLVDSSQAEDRHIIALVSERPLLYTRSTLPVASYYSQVKRLWQEVADIMGWTALNASQSKKRKEEHTMKSYMLTVAEVRRKWSHIRNSYSRHLRNETHGLRTGRGRMVSRWYLADELEFLRHHMATDTRPSLLKLEKTGATAWYAAPEPAPASVSNDDSCASVPDTESGAYFQFFRAIHKDYLELTPVKRRFFRRNCLILLHSLVDGEAAGAAGPAEPGALNLSCEVDSDSEREQKVFASQFVSSGPSAPQDASEDASLLREMAPPTQAPAEH